MHVLVSLFLTLMMVAGPLRQAATPAGQAKPAEAWDAKSIEWQKVDLDGTKWSVLEGRTDVPGEAFTYAVFIPAGYHEHHWQASDARVAFIQGALPPSYLAINGGIDAEP